MGIGGVVWYYFLSKAEGLDVTADDMLEMCLLPLFALPMLAIGWWQMLNSKPIYERWVHQHGTDPDKWPAPAKPE